MEHLSAPAEGAAENNIIETRNVLRLYNIGWSEGETSPLPPLYLNFIIYSAIFLSSTAAEKSSNLRYIKPSKITSNFNVSNM